MKRASKRIEFGGVVRGALLGLALLGFALPGFASVARAQLEPEVDPVERPESLWLAEGGGVVEVSREGAEVLRQVPDSGEARALALDWDRELLWHVSNGALSLWPLTGDPGLTLPLRLEDGQKVFLDLYLQEGSAWVGLARSVRAYGSTGQLLLDIPLEGRLQALALFSGLAEEAAGDGPRGPASSLEPRLWAATGEAEGDFTPFAVISYDLATGEPLTRLELTTGDQVTGLVVEPTTGTLWVSFANRLARYDHEGTLLGESLFEDGTTSFSHLVPDGFGGLWAVRPGHVVPDGEAEPARLRRLDEEGTELLSVVPFSGSTEVRRLRLDEATRSVWGATANQLQRFSAAGYVLSTLDLGPEADLRDLALGVSEVDQQPPSLILSSPASGETVATAQPEIHVSWSDGGAGVNPDSLVFEAGGVFLATTCESTREGAVCLPLASLPEGEITLFATVADFLANASPPAFVTFTVETEISGDPDDPETTGAPTVFHATSIERGLEANKVYLAGSDIETISPANGNLSLSIPIGQVYTVGPNLSYQVRVNYNSNIWQRVIVDCNAPGVNCTAGTENLEVMVPNPASNAGLGWEVHFGRLYAITKPPGLSGLDAVLWPNSSETVIEPNRGWLYVAPDGANHQFFKMLNRPSGAQYTKDGSHLRLKEPPGSNTVEVHHPNGVVSVFEKTGDFAGTLFCGPGVTSGCTRFKEQRDPRGNYFAVSYQRTGFVETWTVTDSLTSGSQRKHELVFSTNDSHRQGGDGSSAQPFTRSNGDEWGDPRRVLQSVKLASFGGGQAVWTLERKNMTASRGCPLESSPQLGEPTSLKTVRLWKIKPPALQPYVFDTATGSGQGCSNLSGKVTQVTLPSGGKLSYGWGNWSFPTRCTYRGPEPQFEPSLRYQQLGIATKSRRSPSGALEGTWTYSNTLMGDGSYPAFGIHCDREDYRETTVDGPVVDSHFSRQVFYNSVAEGPEIPAAGQSIDTWQVTDDGLPYTKDISIGTSTASRRFLSRETYNCKVGQTCGESHKRTSVYVRYASEWKPVGDCIKRVGHSPSCWVGNATPIAERTIYHQDADRYVERLFNSQTGLGFPRKVVTKDNFALNSVRTVRVETDYEKGHSGLVVNGTTGYFNVNGLSQSTPGVGSAWILHPAKYERRIEGLRTYQTDFEYNGFGELLCSRRRVGSGLAAQDVVTRFTIGTTPGVNLGLPVKETHFGGDGALVSTNSNAPCPASESSSQPTYVRTHAYEHLTLASSRIGTFPFEYRVEIDRATGLPKASFDVSNQRTALAYDVLGRLTGVTPAASLREATTQLIHRNPFNANPSVEVLRRGPGGALLTKTVREFDGFGRLDKRLVQRPLEPGGWEFVKQEFGYDAAGRKRFETTLQENCSPTPQNGCTFNRNQRREWKDYLPDGRAQTVIAPDGTRQEYVYQGIRRVAEEVQVRTSLARNEPVRNLSFYDPQGRLERSVRGEKKSGVTWIDEIYTEDYDYDPAGQRLQTTRKADGQTQIRSYKWDGRGFLTKETHPELGVDGGASASITYKRNALGLMRERQDPLRTLTFFYDGAGRRTRVKEGSKNWERYTWGTSTSSSNLSLGKLESATRYNYTGGPGPETEWRVEETYIYGGGLGQVSERSTEVNVYPPGGGVEVGPKFETEWGYDRLGAVVRLDYPECISATCTGSADLPGPPRRVTTAYLVGLPISITSTQNLSSSYAYQRNLSLQSISYGNTMSSVFGPDPHGLSRPRRIRHAKGAQTLFDSGLYEYDGVGNTWKIGADRFLYDRVGRLTLGTVRQAGAGHQETYAYDGFDNVLERVRNQGAPTTFSTDHKNRLLGAFDDVDYDAAGHMRQIGLLLDGSPNITAEWDALGMQLAFKRHAPQFQQYVYIYGPGNLRLLSFDSGEGALTWNQRDLSGKILRTWRHTGSLDVSSPASIYQYDKDYLYGPQGMFASYSAAGETAYFHNDHLGSPRLITNEIGQAIGRHHYYPFGDEVFPGTPYDDRICKFTGHERDPNQGTDYMLGRTYVFSFQRFMSVDPGRDGWNLYAYVGNNPVNRYDPTGLYGLSATYKRIRAISDAVDAVLDFAEGAGDAVGSNALGGLGREEGGNTAFQTGQVLGDTASIVQGAFEMAAGTIIASGGTLVAAGTGGAASPVAVPAVVGGTAAMTHGLVMSASGAGNLAESLSRMSSSSSSGHTKGARPSTKGKHEAGDARRGRDRGGEKGDANRRPPRKKPKDWDGSWPPKTRK